MTGLEELSFAWVAIWCFALTVVSAIVPWVNAEVMVLALPAFAGSELELVLLVLVATAGQMSGKLVVYWSGRGAGNLSRSRAVEAVERWRGRFEQRPHSALGMVFLSSAVGIPPFYVISLLAGAMKMKLGGFLFYGTCGRLVRFGLLAFFPQLVVGVFQ